MDRGESKIIKEAEPPEFIKPLLSAGVNELRAALQSDDSRTRAMALLIMELRAPHDEGIVSARAKSLSTKRYRVVP